MTTFGSSLFRKLGQLLVAPTVEPGQRAVRIQTVEKDVILPIKAVIVSILFYYFFLAEWIDARDSVRERVLYVLRCYFVFYVAVNAVFGWLIFRLQQISLSRLQWLMFSIGVLDAVLMAGLTFMDKGYDSNLFWVFPALILHNALAIPLALPQILLNVVASIAYLLGGFFNDVAQADYAKRFGIILQDEETWRENPLSRFIVLVLWAACCYGIQTLLEKQRRAEAEATEFAVRQERLHTAGRLAAEIAHQLKNPLGIITNAAFCLEHSLRKGERDVEEQIQIIREEIERADQIITELMGYAQLAEGRVESLVVTDEIDTAISQVLPPGAKYNITVHRNYAANLPGLLMQRRHLNGVLVNLLQNAREAMGGNGVITISTKCHPNEAICIQIADTGPGIAPDKIDKIFDAYFTTRTKGTGLGLAIVKHNTEIYGGTVKVKSELGKGTTFVLQFPARILMKVTS